jgi:hypothetical protein
LGSVTGILLTDSSAPSCRTPEKFASKLATELNKLILLPFDEFGLGFLKNKLYNITTLSNSTGFNTYEVNATAGVLQLKWVNSLLSGILP